MAGVCPSALPRKRLLMIFAVPKTFCKSTSNIEAARVAPVNKLHQVLYCSHSVIFEKLGLGLTSGAFSQRRISNISVQQRFPLSLT